MYRTLFAEDNVYGKKNRHDAVLYSTESAQYVGILEAILVHYCSKSSKKVVLLQCMNIIAADIGNNLVVQSFSNQQYSYHVSPASQIHTCLVLTSTRLQPITLVVDPFWLKQLHGINHRIDDIPSDSVIQPTLRFFRVCRFNIYRRTQHLGSAK